MEEPRAGARKITTLSQLMRSAKAAPGSFEVDVPADWMQGRSVFGGLQAAIAVGAMRTLVPSTTLRTVQATFVAPAPEGTVRAEARVIRQGKNAVHVEATLGLGEAPLAIVVAVFGSARASKARRMPVQPRVDAGGPKAELAFVAGITPSFVQHFEARWLRGALPFSGQQDPEQVVDVAMNDEGPVTEAHVLAIADFIPPIALSYLDAPAPGSTLTWMLELLREDVGHLPCDGWRIDAELIAAQDGYTSQAVSIWAPDGGLVALSRQSMLVFG